MIEIKTIRQKNLRRLSAKYGSQSAVAQLCGRSRAQINALCTGKSPIGEKLARQLEKELKISPFFLDSPSETNAKDKILPVYMVSDIPKRTSENIVTYISIDYPKDPLFGVLIQTDILEPMYSKNTILAIHETKEIQHGDLVLLSFIIDDKILAPLFRYAVINENNNIGFVNPTLNNEPEYNLTYKYWGRAVCSILNISPSHHLKHIEN